MTWHKQWGNGGNWEPYGTYPFDKVVSHQTPKFPKNGKTRPMESAGGAAVQLEIATTSLIQISSKSGKKIKYCRYWATNTNPTSGNIYKILNLWHLSWQRDCSVRNKSTCATRNLTRWQRVRVCVWARSMWRMQVHPLVVGHYPSSLFSDPASKRCEQNCPVMRGEDIRWAGVAASSKNIRNIFAGGKQGASQVLAGTFLRWQIHKYKNTQM